MHLVFPMSWPFFNMFVPLDDVHLIILMIFSAADKFTVLSFLEALEDSVSSESSEAESRQDENKDLPSQRCSGCDAMDEGQ